MSKLFAALLVVIALVVAAQGYTFSPTFNLPNKYDEIELTLRIMGRGTLRHNKYFKKQLKKTLGKKDMKKAILKKIVRKINKKINKAISKSEKRFTKKMFFRKQTQ